MSVRNFVPELDIQAEFSKFSGFCKRVGSVSKYSTFNFAFVYICTNEEQKKGKPVYFTPEAEDEVIRESI